MALNTPGSGFIERTKAIGKNILEGLLILGLVVIGIAAVSGGVRADIATTLNAPNVSAAAA